MPNLGLHIGFALDCARQLGHPPLTEHRGAYLLGCTTPDIRLALGWDRARTHFFNLETDGRGTGVPRLLAENPHLQQSGRLDAQTTAFILGYMSHLETDETWIVQVWRKFFGEGTALGDDPLANVYDRLFQFDLDRSERQGIPDLEGAVQNIRQAYGDLDVGFIDGASLRYWQQNVVTRLDRDLPWERFRGFINRVHRAAPEEEVDRIMGRLPEMLAHVRTQVDEAELRSFRRQAIDAFVIRATKYLQKDGVA